MPRHGGRLGGDLGILDREVQSFVVAGYSLRKAARSLKIAFPRKKEVAGATIVLSVMTNKVTLAMPGASFGMPALASGEFNVEVPFVHFKPALTEPVDQGAVVVFSFSEGSLAFLGVEVRTPEVRLKRGVPPGVEHVEEHDQISISGITNPEDASFHLPLVAAFAVMKRRGRGTPPADLRQLQAERELERILKRADKLLAPLGIGRTEIEAIASRRIGDHGA